MPARKGTHEGVDWLDLRAGMRRRAPETCCWGPGGWRDSFRPQTHVTVPFGTVKMPAARKRARDADQLPDEVDGPEGGGHAGATLILVRDMGEELERDVVVGHHGRGNPGVAGREGLVIQETPKLARP